MGIAALRVFLAMGVVAAAGCQAQEVSPKYPLRLHVLAIDETHRTVRMQPNWCAGSVPDMGGSGDATPCSNRGTAGLGGGENDFAGGGRGDLVLPPDGTEAVTFRYEGCARIRVPVGFQALPARWKKAGRKLEVMLPTDDPTRDGRVRTERCTLDVTPHEFVFLRLRNGAIVQVSQEAYWKKPVLRMFLSGGTRALEQRKSPVVSVKELAKTVSQL